MPGTVIGILAHVDAGKTTLSEAMLYLAGSIRKLGRVDHADAFLDNFALERERGITIFAKQALLTLGERSATLLDTPGHVDFSAETERTLDVLDCAILVVSAPEGIQSHTRTLWKLLRDRNVPTALFINKTDLPGWDKEKLMGQLASQLGDGFFDPAGFDPEALALCDEELLEELLARGKLSDQAVTGAFRRGRVYPCWCGAALKLEGVRELMEGLERFAPESPAGPEFAARVFKISRDAEDKRLTHMKITGGVLRVRDILSGPDWEEKVTQIRLYSGAKFTSVDQALPGDVVAVTGLSATFAGQGLGAQEDGHTPALEPVLNYAILLPEGCEQTKALAQLRRIGEENPELHLDWDEKSRGLTAQLMGQVQLEVLKKLAHDRFGLDISFGPGGIIYRETIADRVEGVGHYEPLRHYAEVHLILEPGERGSGVEIRSAVPEDVLARNWQRLILTHLHEKQHLGVLTGSPITDIRITLAAGRAHLKHTEGGDFREATYRAVRQGLMSARSVLLEPWYDFRIELPQGSLGRAMTDLQRMGAVFDRAEDGGELPVLTGSGPVSALREYPAEVTAYTRGAGRVSFVFHGYEPCADQQAVVDAVGYDPEADLDNPCGSVFCSHGVGYAVPWDQVPARMHLESVLAPPKPPDPVREAAARYVKLAATDKELMAIFERTYGRINRGEEAMRPAPREPASQPRETRRQKPPQKDDLEFVLVDGYNIIFAWEDLKALAAKSLDSARERLIERLRNYQGFRQCAVIVVFDAYKVKNNPGSVEHLGGLSVVYTKEAETADMYIERATYDLSKRHKVRVATSDGMEQMIILGNGALRVPAAAFEAEVKGVERAIMEYLKELAELAKKE